MKNLKLLFSLVLAAGCVTMIGCSKSNNNSGGSTTTKDSVLYTNWTPLNMNGFVLSSGDTFYNQTIVAKSITSAVVDRGIVLGYVMDVDQNSGDTLIENVTNIMTFIVYPDSIYLESDPVQPSPSAGRDFTGVPFRYVVIPGSIHTTGASGGATAGAANGYTAAQLNALPYATVKKMFNLPELFDLPKGYQLKSKRFLLRNR